MSREDEEDLTEKKADDEGVSPFTCAILGGVVGVVGVVALE